MDKSETPPPSKKKRRNSAYLLRKAAKRRLKGENARSVQSRFARRNSDARLTDANRQARKKSDSRLTDSSRRARKNSDFRLSDASREARKNSDSRLTDANRETRKNSDSRLSDASREARKNSDSRLSDANREAKKNSDNRLSDSSHEARKNSDNRLSDASREARKNSDNRLSDVSREARKNSDSRLSEGLRELRRDTERRRSVKSRNQRINRSLHRSNDYRDYLTEEYDEKKQDLGYLSREYEESIKGGPDLSCQCCDCLFFAGSIHFFKKADILEFCSDLYHNVYCVPEEGDDVRFCNTCAHVIKKQKVPILCLNNGLRFLPVPTELEVMTPLEERLVSPRLPFMQIRELRVGKQFGIKGNVVNVPISVEKSIDVLPRTFDKMETVQLLPKRMRLHKSSYLNELIRPAVVYCAAQYLVHQPLYKEEGVKLNVDWTQIYGNVIQNFIVDEIIEENDGKDDQILDDRWDETRDDQPLNPNKEETYLKEGIIFAPGEGERPLSILSDKTVEELAFPKIFCGQARQTASNLSYSDICRSELKRSDRRCVTNITNIFFKYRKKEMEQHRSAIQIHMRKGYSRDRNMTVQEALSDDAVSKLVKEDEIYKVLLGDRSSPAYWQGRMKELMAMIRQLGKPDFFLTLSAAETHWKELLIILVRVLKRIEITEEQAIELSFEQKCELIRSDPVTCARYFDHRIRQLFKVVKAPCGPFEEYKVVDTYIRVEFQSRGSPHVHCLIWLEGAPVFDVNNVDTWAKCEEFIDKHISCEVGLMNGLERLQYHKHSGSCKKARMDSIVCRFGIPQFPMRTTRILQPLKDEDLSEDELEIFDHIMARIEEVLGRVDDSVKKKSPESVNLTFDDFLKEANVSEETYIRVLQHSLKRPQVFLKRRPSEIRTNAFNPLILKLHRANMDLQFIIDPYACVHYILNYINKSNRGMSTLLKEVVDECKRGNVSHREKLYKVCSKFLNCSEVSVQEAVYILLSMPLSKASRDTIFINTGEKEKRTRVLKSSKELELLEAGSTDIMGMGLLDYYVSRPDELESICLADFAAKFTFKKHCPGVEISEDMVPVNEEPHKFSKKYSLINKLGTVYERKRAKVIRYRKYQLAKDPSNYYREKVMLYLPWRNEDEDILNKNVKSLFEENREHIFNIEKEYVFDAQLDLDDLEHRVEEERKTSFESFQQDEIAEEFQVFGLQNTEYDIEQNIKESGNTNTTGTFLSPHIMSDESYSSLIRSLNEEQRNFLLGLLNVVKSAKNPFYYFLTGGAGTGKSLLIKSVYQTLNHWYNRGGTNPDEIKVLLLGPTGKSAFNIRGMTVHSALHIPVTQNGQIKNLSADLKSTMMKKLGRLKALIIDEVSMVGSSMLRRIDHRLKEIFNTQEIFGGISILFVGDFNQLRPVMDNFLFNPPASSYASLAGTFLWSPVRFFRLTEIMRQKDDLIFAQALNRLAIGCLTGDDKQLFESRLYSKGSTELPFGAVRLFQYNEQVNKYNTAVLEQTEGQQFHSFAYDFAAQGLSKKVRDTALKVVSGLPTQSTYNLVKDLALKVGIRYMVSTNVDVEDGLVNGTTGILRHIDLENEKLRILWLEFEESDIGLRARSKFQLRKTDGIALTPIERVVKDIQTKAESKFVLVSRRQFPLLIAEAITIHKAQGQTYDQVVIDMSRKMDLAKFYTSFSRAKTLAGLYLVGPDIIFPKERPDSHPVSMELKRLETKACLEFELKFPTQLRAEGQMAILFQNLPFLYKHADDLSCDKNILACDILALVETRSSDVMIDGFDLRYQLPYQGQRPFGIGFYTRNGFDPTISMTTRVDIGDNDSHMEQMRVDLQFAVLIIYYVSPKFNKKKAMAFIEEDAVSSINRNLFMVGDWNIDILSKTGEEFNKMMAKFGLRRYPQLCQPSTDSGTTIDYAFSSMSLDHCFFYESVVSDHKPIVSMLSVSQ